ncbi:MAG: hypothetical protein Q7S96_00720 [bacterium]|nr:hypothetical protein [bacterium]
MSERPPSESPRSHIARENLPREVRSYVRNLEQQIRDHFRSLGYQGPLTNIDEVETAVASLRTTATPRDLPSITHLTTLSHALSEAYRTGTIPESESFSLPITATVLPHEDSASSFEAEREITLDLQEILDSSLTFLQDKAPPSWVSSLEEEFPTGLRLTPEQRETIKTAIEHGFTSAILLPDAKTQGITPTPEHPETLEDTTNHLLNTCSNADGAHPVPGLPTNDPDGQYAAPYLRGETLKTPTLPPETTPIENTDPPHTRTVPQRTRPYLLLYRKDGILPETRNQTFPQCETILTQRATDWNLPTLTGFTTLEHLLIQRKETEARAPLAPTERTAQYGDPRVHGFDMWSTQPDDSRWAWNLDSRVSGGCAGGYWSSGTRQSGLVWDDAVRRLVALGARPAVVVEL